MMSFLFKLRIPAPRLSLSLTKRATYYFSTPADAATSTESTNISAENLGIKDKATKDEDYQEMALKFERDWKKFTEEKTEQQMKALNEELTENQKKRVELIVQALLEMNMFELRYFASSIKSRIQRSTGMNPLKINLDWPSLKKLDDGSWPPANPNWFMQQEAMAKLWPMGMQGFSQAFGGMFGAPGVGGAAGGQVVEAPKQTVKEEKKEEKKVEKTNFDVELTGIDQAQKIKIIKEVRQILSLGLKEAKEMVEKAPVVLKKDLKKEEAEQLKEKLTAIGCTMTLL